MTHAALKQRADYTHKHNLKTGRHGWLRLTPAYSVKVVEEIIEQCSGKLRIFDPFCGTATTALSAAYHGHEGITTDINPFLVWLGKAKTDYYSHDSLTKTKAAVRAVLEKCSRKKVVPQPAPPLHNIERWWNPTALDFLCHLRQAIYDASEQNSQQRTLLMVAFCRTLIATSNAAFNHQSMSFKDTGQLPLEVEIDYPGMFRADVDFVLNGAADNPDGSAEIVLGDSRNAKSCVKGKFHRVITSPPYANRMSYIRELRPYMYWLGFLVNGRDAGEMDWQAIGGTWGVATSRLIEWKPSKGEFQSKSLKRVVNAISHVDNKNGELLANYVSKYFDDMWAHFRNLSPVLADGCELHYIVGNSTFYGVLLPVEDVYAEMLRELGFTDVACRAIRKRNSKKELIEFDVTAKWQ